MLHSSLTLLEIEREREERLSRILNMERELAVLRTREETTTRRSQTLNEPAYDRYDRYDTYRSRDRSPPPRRESDYPPVRDYPRNDRLGYEGARGDDRGGRSYYNGRSNSPGARGGGLGRDGFSSSSGVGGDSYREPVSYPISGRGGYDHRDNPSQLLGGGGGGGGGTGMGYGSRGGSGMGQSSNPSVGYGSSGGKLGMGGAPPPGWPSSDYDKSNANRPPFAWN